MGGVLQGARQGPIQHHCPEGHNLQEKQPGLSSKLSNETSCLKDDHHMLKFELL